MRELRSETCVTACKATGARELAPRLLVAVHRFGQLRDAEGDLRWAARAINQLALALYDDGTTAVRSDRVAQVSACATEEGLMAVTMPRQKPRRSKQDYATPAGLPRRRAAPLRIERLRARPRRERVGIQRAAVPDAPRRRARGPVGATPGQRLGLAGTRPLDIARGHTECQESTRPTAASVPRPRQCRRQLVSRQRGRAGARALPQWSALLRAGLDQGVSKRIACSRSTRPMSIPATRCGTGATRDRRTRPARSSSGRRPCSTRRPALLF